MQNVFATRNSELSSPDEEFAQNFAADALQVLPENAFAPGALIIRSAPGGGKTSLLRMFTPGPLEQATRNRSHAPFSEIYQQLEEIGAIGNVRPQLLGIHISSNGGYPEIGPPLSKGAAAGLFKALLNARTLLNNFLGRLIQPSAERPLASDTNLHVIFAESASLDAKIVKKELEPELATIQGLSVRLDEEAADAWPKIWFPVLGEGNREALDRIHTQINPADVCPILPLQTRDARRADNIVGEVGELLFDRFKVDPRDLIYATEDNPFQLYRNLLAAMERYEDSLAELGGVRFILSPLSSKGLSVGALLACYENKNRTNAGGFNVRTGFAYIETSRYEASSLTGSESGTPVSLWLTGTCYAA